MSDTSTSPATDTHLTPLIIDEVRRRYSEAMNQPRTSGVTAEIRALHASVSDVPALILRVAALEEELITAYASSTRARDRAESAERSLRIIATFIEQNTVEESDVKWLHVAAFNADGERVF